MLDKGNQQWNGLPPEVVNLSEEIIQWRSFPTWKCLIPSSYFEYFWCYFFFCLHLLEVRLMGLNLCNVLAVLCTILLLKDFGMAHLIRLRRCLLNE